MTPTEEQKSICEAIGLRGASAPSVMIEAAAGCAKTTTLALAAPLVKVPALALAFNKRIADGMKDTLPKTFAVKTMNGLGHGAWLRSLPPAVKLELDDRKLGKLVSQVSQDAKLGLTTDQWSSLRELVSRAMSSGLVPQSRDLYGVSLVEDTRQGWQTIADELLLFREDFEVLWEAAREVLVRDIDLARAGTISFDDQIYCSVMLGGRFPLYPMVFVDEDQDLSPMQVAMVAKCLRPDGRLVACGDKRQAIYAWRGAMGQAAEALRGLKHEVEWTDRSLLTTFRCPKVTVARQQRHVPGFRAWEGAAEGLFVEAARLQEETGDWSWADIQNLSVGAETRGLRASVAVLCRNNAPLLSLAFKLLRQGIGVHMLGREIGKGLQTLAKKLSKDELLPIGKFLGLLAEWEETERSKCLVEDRPDRLAGILDRADCLRAIADGTSSQTLGQLLHQLDALFARSAGAVTLSSIHRAKGLEWDLVVHLDPWRIPSRQARASAEAGSCGPMEQEMNLRYVCETRTKHTLVNARLEDFV